LFALSAKKWKKEDGEKRIVIILRHPVIYYLNKKPKVIFKMIIYLVHLPGIRGIKIGITKNIRRRIYNLSAGCPISVEQIAYLEVNDMKIGYKKEHELHDLFDYKRICGEWFDLSDEDINMLILEYGFKRYNPPVLIIPSTYRQSPISTRESAIIMSQSKGSVCNKCRNGSIKSIKIFGPSGQMEFKIYEKDLYEYMIKMNCLPKRKKFISGGQLINSTSLEQYYTISDAVQILKVDKRTIRAWIESGKIKAIRVGRHYRIPANAIEELK
jgi:excisionase family DNA binding protein